MFENRVMVVHHAIRGFDRMDFRLENKTENRKKIPKSRRFVGYLKG
jgi:hypothetical protein